MEHWFSLDWDNLPRTTTKQEWKKACHWLRFCRKKIEPTLTKNVSKILLKGLLDDVVVTKIVDGELLVVEDFFK